MLFFYRYSINCHWILAIATCHENVLILFSARVFMDKFTINKYLSNCTHRKYSFSPLRAPDLQNAASPEYIVEFSTPCMRIGTKPPVRLALFADCETRQNISICLYIWLVRCIGNIAPRSRSVSPGRFPPRCANGTYLEFGARGYALPLSPGHLRHPLPHGFRQRAANGTLNASKVVHDATLWTCWVFVTCHCNLSEKRSNGRWLTWPTD